MTGGLSLTQDFVTLLFAVFVVLFACSLHRKQSIRSVSTAIRSAFDSLSAQTSAEGESPVGSCKPASIAGPRFDSATLSRQLQSILGDSISRHEIVMQRTSEGLIVSLRELGFFNSGEAILLPGAAAKLQQTARLLMSQGFEVRVEGHSDDQADSQCLLPLELGAFNGPCDECAFNLRGRGGLSAGTHLDRGLWSVPAGGA